LAVELLTHASTARRDSASASPTPRDFTLAKDNGGNPSTEQTGSEQISAADYDPSLDRREDEQRRLGGEPKTLQTVEDEIEEVDEEEDVDDMFALPSSDKKVKKVKKIKVVCQVRSLSFPLTFQLEVERPRTDSNHDS